VGLPPLGSSWSTAKDARPAGWPVNDKRVRRLWRDEGLKVPYKRRKKRLCGIGTHVGAMWPIRPNALWALDVQFDVTIDGRTLKLLNEIDDFTREYPAIVVTRSIDADAVVATLDRLTRERGAPGSSASTTGPSSSPMPLLTGAGSTVSPPCSSTPARHGRTPRIESFNGRLRDELLNGWQFDSLLEAQVIIEDWRIDYNDNRPHTAHGDLTPSEFAQAWTINQPQAA